MARPWTTLATVETREGPLELRQRDDDDFLILIAGRVLMTSKARRSEEVLATLAAGALKDHPARRVLIGGLGMGYTLRAALDAMPEAKVTVVELTREVEAWCRGPMAPLTGDAVADPRVTIVIDDVARTIGAAAAGSFDVILLDLYEGPYQVRRGRPDPLFGHDALTRTRSALAPGGVLAVWSEDPAPAFPGHLAAAGLTASVHKAGRGGRRHVIYLGRREAARPARPARPPRS